MHFDALAMAYMCAELSNGLAPGRVQQVLLPTSQSVAFEIFGHGHRQWLMIDANPAEARVLVESDKVRRGVDKETPLLLLLRKYVRDAVLTAVEQPDPSERLLLLHFQHAQHGKTTLVVELMGRATNIVLLREDGRILDLLRRAPEHDSAGRLMMPGKIWSMPAAGERISPLERDDARWAAALEAINASDLPLWRALMQTLRGIGKSQAQEIALRALGTVEGALEGTARDTSLLAIADAIAQFWEPVHSGSWSPGVWTSGGRVVGYSPWVSHSSTFSPRMTLSQAMGEYFESKRLSVKKPAKPANDARLPEGADAASDGYAITRAAVDAMIAKARKRTVHALGALEHDLPQPREAERLRTEAGWLLALQHTIAPDQRELVVEADQESLIIALDPTQTSVEQAQAMYKRAAKSERASLQIPIRRATLEDDLTFLDQAEGDLARATNAAEIEAVRAILRESGLLGPQTKKEKLQRPPPSKPRKYRAADGTRILVGRNAKQNDALTFTTAHPEDLWMHVRGAPGSHVVIVTEARPVADETLTLAAQLAAWHSDKRDDGNVDVIVAERKRLARPPGGRPGQVLVRDEKVMRAWAGKPEVEEES